MEFRKLIAQSLSEALMGMQIGETCIAPDGYTPATVIKTCCELQGKGALFSTSTRTGVQTVTRLK